MLAARVLKTLARPAAVQLRTLSAMPDVEEMSLKETLVSMIPEKQAELKALKAEHGDARRAEQSWLVSTALPRRASTETDRLRLARKTAATRRDQSFAQATRSSAR